MFQPTANTALLAANATGATTVVVTTGGSGFLVTNTDSGNTVFVNIGAAATVPAAPTTTTIAANTAVANATTQILTVTYAAQGNVPFAVNSYVNLSGFTPLTYNATSSQVISASNTQITVSTIGTGNVTVLGNVSQTINNSTDTVPVLPGTALSIAASPALLYPGNVTVGAITLSGTANVFITPGQ